MNKVFDGVQFNGVVKPGQVYILTSGGPLSNAETLFTIRTDEEALAAVDLLIILICDLDIELIEYLGIEKLSAAEHDEETYEISLICYDNRAEKLYTEQLILERLRTFEEEAAWMKEHFRPFQSQSSRNPDAQSAPASSHQLPSLLPPSVHHPQPPR